MQRLAALLVITLLASGCATSGSRWELAALGAALADIGSTGGGLANGAREANPIYGQSPSAEKMLAINLGAYAGVWSMTRNRDEVAQQRMWRNVTIIRLLVTGWNLSQSGCACFRFTF
jgi:hypothetical protein